MMLRLMLSTPYGDDCGVSGHATSVRACQESDQRCGAVGAPLSGRRLGTRRALVVAAVDVTVTWASERTPDGGDVTA